MNDAAVENNAGEHVSLGEEGTVDTAAESSFDGMKETPGTQQLHRNHFVYRGDTREAEAFLGNLFNI